MLIQRINLRNLLSFGDPLDLELRPLNVLIGPNGSGKSNIIEAISLLRSTVVPAAPNVTGDLRDVIRKGGGVMDWLYKGRFEQPATITATVDVGEAEVRHSLQFRQEKLATFAVHDESIERLVGTQRTPAYEYNKGLPFMVGGRGKVGLDPNQLDLNQSILAQRNDPESYPDLALLSAAYRDIRIFRDWHVGRGSSFRSPQPADVVSTPLAEDFSNLALFLGHLKSRQPEAFSLFMDRLRDLYEGVTGLLIAQTPGGSHVQIVIEEGPFLIPANRLSDGTLRFLSLLAILCDPDPPGLICIEEPEIGLHPDLIPKIADLLVDASTRTQLIVTTHSDVLVDALTGSPESVVICEKHDGSTTATRLASADLNDWLDKYRLGELWTRGDLGGTRW